MKTPFKKLEIEIRAPRNMIWNALSDISNYGQWNSIVPYARGNLSEGQRLVISLKLNDRAKKGICYVHMVSPYEYFVLSRKWLFKWLLYMEHSFIIQPAKTSDNTHRFIQTLAISGVLSRPMIKIMRSKWQRFNRMNRDLKKYIIKQHHGTITRLDHH